MFKQRSRRLRLVVVGAVALLTGVGCSGSDGGDPPPLSVAATTSTSTPADPAGPTDTSAPATVDVGEEPDGTIVDGGAVGSVQEATVRVVTTGTYVTPDFGQLDSSAGSGSAFVVDPSGLAVTNNHVVAGAAIVEVYVAGSDVAVPASVVATSECSDLAVIDLAGDGYTTLAWADEPVGTGTTVRAAGYPGGEPEFTLTEGIVSRASVDGATPWAAIGSLMQHDADLQPGNSGGPLVDVDGRVLGVNVAASAAGRFAVPAELARPIVDELVGGEDVDSIGLNVVAVWDEVSNESGVWVVSVRPGSPAATAGLQPGDVITRMKGVRVALDGTLADYCGVLRSTGSDPIPLEIRRDGSMLAGAVFGGDDATLAPVLAVANDTRTAARQPARGVDPPAGTSYEAFDRVTDATGVLAIDIPSAWADRTVTPIDIAGGSRPSIAASTDIAALDAATGATYDVAGVAAIVFGQTQPIGTTFDVAVTQNAPWAYECVGSGPQAFDDGTYRGVFEVFGGCNEAGAMVVSVAIERIGSGRWMLINVFAPTLADVDAATRILETFDFYDAATPPPIPPTSEAPTGSLPQTSSIEPSAEGPTNAVGRRHATVVEVDGE